MNSSGSAAVFRSPQVAFKARLKFPDPSAPGRQTTLRRISTVDGDTTGTPGDAMIFFFLPLAASTQCETSRGAQRAKLHPSFRSMSPADVIGVVPTTTARPARPQPHREEGVRDGEHRVDAAHLLTRSPFSCPPTITSCLGPQRAQAAAHVRHCRPGVRIHGQVHCSGKGVGSSDVR